MSSRTHVSHASPRIARAARFAAAIALVSASAAGAQDVTVGAGADCDFNDLQAAVDAAEQSAQATIRIAARQLRDLALEIAPRGTLIVAGGYADCSASTATGVTDLIGTLAEPVVAVDGPPTARVVFRDLLITQGSGVDGGGISIAGGAGALLIGTRVNGNDAVRGGGIALTGGTLTLSTSIVSSNRAISSDPSSIEGGGIHCSGGGRVELLAASRVLANSADRGAGGGVYLEGGCRLFLSSNAFDLPTEIEGNRARFGGGIFARSSAAVVLQGDGHTAVRIRANRAEASGPPAPLGGGIALTAGSSLTARNALIEDNLALGGSGGALAVLAGSTATVRRSLGPTTCHTADRCSRTGGNRADRGAAALVNGSGSTLTFVDTYVEGNVGSESVIAADFAGTVRLEGSVLGENEAPHLVALESGAHGRIAFSTVSGNDGFDAFSVTDGADLDLLAAIVFEPGQDVLATDAPGALAIRCVLAHEIDSLTGGEEVAVGAPEFLNAPADYHLTPDSPAVDFCAVSALAGEVPPDLDLGRRGRDAPAPDRGAGTHFDLGADEVASGEGLFLDGFESGDLSAWDGEI